MQVVVREAVIPFVYLLQLIEHCIECGAETDTLLDAPSLHGWPSALSSWMTEVVEDPAECVMRYDYNRTLFTVVQLVPPVSRRRRLVSRSETPCQYLHLSAMLFPRLCNWRAGIKTELFEQLKPALKSKDYLTYNLLSGIH